MVSSPNALGYLRRDVSRIRQPWDEQRLRSVAKRYGYTLLKTIVFTERTEHPEYRLQVAAMRLEAEAIFVPNLNHFDGTAIPAELVAVADIVTVDDERTYARHASGQLPDLGGTPAKLNATPLQRFRRSTSTNDPA